MTHSAVKHTHKLEQGKGRERGEKGEIMSLLEKGDEVKHVSRAVCVQVGQEEERSKAVERYRSLLLTSNL